MSVVTSIATLFIYTCFAYGEASATTFSSLLNRHCSSRCSGTYPTPIYRGRTTDIGLNMTLVNEIVQEKLRSVERALHPLSCKDTYQPFARSTDSTGGVFIVYPLAISIAEVYCDLTTDEGGWTVFQRRKDSTVDFYRGWDDYVHGFGDLQGEFWLGLEKIHLMTKHGDYEMRIDMIQLNGTHRWAKYRSFSLGPASDHYRLFVSGYSGNASDALGRHNNKKFSTYDADHDDSRLTNCAEYVKGAWWYSRCYSSNLNGEYNALTVDGIRWWWQNVPKEGMFMEFTEMKFRKRD